MSDVQPQQQTVNHKRRILIGFLIVLMSCGVLYGIICIIDYSQSIYRNPSKHLIITNLSSETCGPGYDTEVEQVSWNGEHELTCIVSFTDTCELYGWEGDYQIEGKNLILEYFTDGSSASACLCHYWLEFRIGNLERKEYLVTIGNIE
jgi:hypothetical protein